MKPISVALMLALPAAAQAQTVVPAVIKERVNQLVAQCAQAGGTLGEMTGQGRFVIPQDFTGDGKVDFLVSEGNFPCAGKPDLFRRGGQSLLELYVGDGAGNARLAFADRLIAYRILAGKPARLQIARRGAGCGAGTPANANCGHELKWNPAAAQFVEVLTGAETGVTSPPARPAAIIGSAPAQAQAAPSAPPAALTPLGTLAVKPGAEAAYKASCRKQILTQTPSATKWVDEECATRWKAIAAAGPATDALLGAIGAPRDVAGAKAHMPGVRWGNPEKGNLANGRAGGMEITLTGKGSVQQADAGWAAIGAMVPFDVIGAMEARGLSARVASCEKLGVGEGERSYIVTPPGGGKPFGVSVSSRTAPTAAATSYYSATIDLTGKLPAAGQTQCDDF